MQFSLEAFTFIKASAVVSNQPQICIFGYEFMSILLYYLLKLWSSTIPYKISNQVKEHIKLTVNLQ